MIQAGDLAPDFELPDATGETIRLSELRGKTVVLFFYPRADTPGCTAEACAFRDARPDFEAANAVILGISIDEQPAQGKFAAKYGLPYRLLCDPDHKVVEAYGAWVEKNNYGKKYMGTQRSTFIIAPDGTVARAFPKVTVEGHVDKVLEAVKQVTA